MEKPRKNETICQFALRILEPIPESQWTTGTFYNKRTDQSCAIGHLNKSIGGLPYKCTSIADSLSDTINCFFKSLGCLDRVSIIKINDGDTLYFSKNRLTNNKYYSIGPKQRVIITLQDAVKFGY